MGKKTDPQPLLSRRDILKIAGITGGAFLLTEMGGGRNPAQGVARGTSSGPYAWRMVINLEECVGCQYCVRACQAVNDVPDDDMRWNVGFPEQTASGTAFYMTRPCLHCANAPCVKVCPVGATYKRDDGLVMMDYSRCIGCRYCEVACPYDVRRFNWKASVDENPYQPTWGSAEVARRPRGVVEKCTFCVHRIDRGLTQGLIPGVDPQATPACVQACPVNARVFGDLLDPLSPVSRYLEDHETFRLREDFGTSPLVYYVRPGKES